MFNSSKKRKLDKSVNWLNMKNVLKAFISTRGTAPAAAATAGDDSDDDTNKYDAADNDTDNHGNG